MESYMEFLSAPWWSALAAIIVIDLVLAGDNAIVIALAARRLPEHLKRKAIIWGTAGAIGVRVLMTIGVVWLLKIPGLMLLGGLGLIWIAYKLQIDDGEEHGDQHGATTFWGAMRTIIVADALMGVDNVLGIAGASHGAIDLVILGLLISVPIVVFGSNIVLKLIGRFPIIIQIGAAVLAITAAKMIVSEPLLESVFGNKAAAVADDTVAQSAARWAVYVVVVASALLSAWWYNRRASAEQAAKD